MTIANSPQTPVELTKENEIVLHVRDIRKSNYYVVDNIVMDEWVPLIGDIGYTIYSLLVRVSNRRDGESARVSFRLLKQHLGYSSATVMTYIRFLEICQLIYRDKPEILVEQSGNLVKKRIGNRANTYYILDTHSVTPEELQSIKNAVLTDKQIDDGFRKCFVKRITKWKSIDKLWSPSQSSQVKPIITQASLFDGDEGGNGNDSPASSVSTMTKRILSKVDIRDENILAQLSQHDPALILAVIWHGRTEKWVDLDRFSGYVIATLNKSTPPPQGFIYLAEKWLAMTRNERHAFAMNNWPYMKTYQPQEIANELNISEAMATSILALIKSQSFTSFQNWIDIS